MNYLKKAGVLILIEQKEEPVAVGILKKKLPYKKHMLNNNN